MLQENTELIRQVLLKRGRMLFHKPFDEVPFTGKPEADALVNDLEHSPHAFVLACVMDRQIKAERAWLIPHEFRSRLGTFEFEALADLSLRRIRSLMTRPTPLHRFTEVMSECFYEAVKRIETQYGGNAGKIWMDKPSSATVVLRFLEFQGVGPKIATMAANILAREMKIPMSDNYSIDISPDVHVRRVFTRLGLIPQANQTEMLIYRAREMNPSYPGILDLPAFEIGRQWCRPRSPNCANCYMNPVCPSSRAA